MLQLLLVLGHPWRTLAESYEASDVYVGDEGLELLSRSLEGLSEAREREERFASSCAAFRSVQAGEEAWKMKFAIRPCPFVKALSLSIMDEYPGAARILSSCGSMAASCRAKLAIQSPRGFI